MYYHVFLLIFTTLVVVKKISYYQNHTDEGGNI